MRRLLEWLTAAGKRDRAAALPDARKLAIRQLGKDSNEFEVP